MGSFCRTKPAEEKTKMNKFYKTLTALAATAALAGCIEKKEPVYKPLPAETQNDVSHSYTNIVLENGDIIVFPNPCAT